VGCGEGETGGDLLGRLRLGAGVDDADRLVEGVDADDGEDGAGQLLLVRVEDD
jgi:hypothetical protein